MQGSDTHSQLLCGLLAVAITGRQGGLDGILFRFFGHFGQRHQTARGIGLRTTAEIRRQIIDPNDIARHGHHEAFHNVAKLSYVARPSRRHQLLHRAAVNLLDLAPMAVTEMIQKMFDQQRNVFTPFAECRNVNRDDVESIIKVVAKCAFVDHLLHILVGG